MGDDPDESGSTDIDAKGDVIGVGVTGSGNVIAKNNYTIKGSTVVIVASQEDISALKGIISLGTEVPANTAEALKDAQKAGLQPQTGEAINSILQTLDDADKEKGAAGSVTEVSVDGLNISRVDLLVKKAITLKGDAVQPLNDYMERNQSWIASCTIKLSQGGYHSLDEYYSDVFKQFDYAAFKAKLTEASGYLDEAGKLDPTNVEVILNKIETLSFLGSNAPTREWPSIYEQTSHMASSVIALLRAPKDDSERFYLAQATYFLAVSKLNLYKLPQDAEGIRDARESFEKLGRREWVRQCDLVLQQLGMGGGPPAPPSGQGGYQPWAWSGWNQPVGTGFMPVGRWQIRFSGGNAAYVEIAPDGSFVGSATMMGSIHQISGRWDFNPLNQLLQFNGFADGMIPFANAIVIQGQQASGFQGVNATGETCFITPS